MAKGKLSGRTELLIVRRDDQPDVEIILESFPQIKLVKQYDYTELLLTTGARTVIVHAQSDSALQQTTKYHLMLSLHADEAFTTHMMEAVGQVYADMATTNVDQISGATSRQIARDNKIPTPTMSIAILVVGTRGDVQPFICLGQRHENDGLRVRLATHAEYRADIVSKGFEYYPLGDDPRKLSEYMVKTGGRLIPDFFNKEERRELPGR